MAAPTIANDRPAVLGGDPCVTDDQTDALRWPLITSEDEAAVLDVLRSGQLSIHDSVVADLEAGYRVWLPTRHAVAHNNGTSAIHAAIHAFGLGPGDEVLVPSATWWASVMPVLHAGATPVFCETCDDSLGIDPDDAARRISDHTRAMVIVHLFGMPSRLNELLALARSHDLRVLEDASHAHGATYHGRRIGTFGDAAVFSMQGNKLVPSAEGGMLVTDDDAVHERVVRYGHYERLLPMTGSAQRRFAATGFGHKFRMSPLSAAVARVQFRRLAERNARRNANCIMLSQRLEALGCFETFPAPPDCERVYFEFLVRYDERAAGLPIADLVRAVRAEGAMVDAPRYPLLHRQPMFTGGTWATIARVEPDRTYDPDDLPRTRVANARLIRLPSFPNASPTLVDQYALAFERVIRRAGDIPRGEP